MAGEALREYRDALAELYAGTGPAERGAAALAPDAERRADRLIAASGAAGQETAARLDADDADERELAELQLVAGAALDLLTAGDLAEADGADGAAGVERSAGAGDRGELLAILAVPPGHGVGALTGGRTQRSGGPVSRDELLQAVDDAVQDILDAAGKSGQALVTGVLAVDAPALGDAAKAVLQDVLGDLANKATRLLAKAVQLVVRAVQKLMAALGKTAQAAARTEAASWIKKLEDGGVLGMLLTALYQPDRIRADVEQIVPAAEADPQRLVAAHDDLQELVERFGTFAKAIQWLARGLSVLKHWMMGLAPYGPIAWVGISIAGVGFIGYLGGDYVDWHRTDGAKALNFVPGVRDKVSARFAG